MIEKRLESELEGTDQMLKCNHSNQLCSVKNNSPIS